MNVFISIESLSSVLGGRAHFGRLIAITLLALLGGACTGESTNTLSLDPVTDTIPPTVTITAPVASNVTSGNTVTVSANASDNVGVVGVQFQRDGVNLAAEDTTTPYSVSWDTTGLPAGSYNLTAIARDAAGQSSISSAVTMTVTVPAPATGRADLSWTAPTTNEDGSPTSLSGFNIYQGSSNTNLRRITTVGPSTLNHSVNNLTSGTHYFSVTAVGTNGTESTYSNIGSKVIP